MIILTLVMISIGITALLIAGSLRASFEIVMLWTKDGDFSLKEFKNKSKDINKDGKFSWWELTFPKEPVHRQKRVEYVLYGYGMSFLIFGLLGFFHALQWLNIYTLIAIILLAPVIFFATTGFGFDVYFKNNRPK